MPAKPSSRKAEISRKTKETQIRLALNLDGTGHAATRPSCERISATWSEVHAVMKCSPRQRSWPRQWYAPRRPASNAPNGALGTPPRR